jgi:2-polyprenyl-3-methyl-5-hydroxy-6-metoxy-1,4-benzoquinol methylase
MEENEKQSVIEFYESRYNELGYNVKAVGWGSRESQELRFQILSEIGNLSNVSVCDIGCGFGDLFPFLQKRILGINYTGYDITPKLITEAKNRYQGDCVNFEVRDILTDIPKKKFDFVVCSGALSYKTEDHVSFVEKMLQAMFAISNKGIAVNFLSTLVDYQLDKNFHFSPTVAFEMATKLSRKIAIRHDYPLYEFTLYIYNNNHSS